MTNQNHVLHIQYPVGQGGLHLGIIGDVAYIYDCGGYGKNVDWSNFFDEICNQIKSHNAQEIHVFISHWHHDHCNHLEELYDYLKKHGFKDSAPQDTQNKLTPFEQISYLCEFNSTPEEYKEYYNIITGEKLTQHAVFTNTNIKTNTIDINIEKYGLYQFQHHVSQKRSDKMSSSLIDKCKELCNFSIKVLINKMQSYQFRNIVKQYYKIVKHENRYTNHNQMLCLYCDGKNDSNENWLHTGDAPMASVRYRKDMQKHYQSKGISLKYANIIQIPHHASRYNHNSNFFDIFDKTNIRKLYYTIGDGNVKPKIGDLGKMPIKAVSEVSTTKITM